MADGHDGDVATAAWCTSTTVERRIHCATSPRSPTLRACSSLGGDASMVERGRTGVGGARYTPLLWLGMSLVATALFLPSALRPPPDAANTSAQFSPDAPPDDDPQAIIQSLQQAASRTAGARTGEALETTT